jgi:hypothetical protein
MLILMETHATPDQVREVLSLLEGAGLRCQVN